MLVVTERGKAGRGEQGASARLSRRELVDRFLELRPALARRFAAVRSPELRGELGSVTLHQLEVLHGLAGGDVTMSKLARRLDISESAATDLADRLVRQGLVERRAGLRDRRVVVLALSEEGRRIIGRIERQRRKMAESILGALSDAQLGELLGLIEVMVAGSSSADAVGRSSLGNPGPQPPERVDVPGVRRESGRESIPR
ncbi:MAG TPA: MarR family transcriptional regulator [Acidimicrobiales bacterium]|nr:MarR family transcriptional regulator [Acidimicrobiales bacterium]